MSVHIAEKSLIRKCHQRCEKLRNSGRTCIRLQCEISITNASIVVRPHDPGAIRNALRMPPHSISEEASNSKPLLTDLTFLGKEMPHNYCTQLNSGCNKNADLELHPKRRDWIFETLDCGCWVIKTIAFRLLCTVCCFVANLCLSVYTVSIPITVRVGGLRSLLAGQWRTFKD